MHKIIKIIAIFVIFLSLFLLRDYIYNLIGLLKYNNDYNLIKVELETLKTENRLLTEEVNNLTKLNNLTNNDKFDYQLAKVIIRNPYTFFDTLIINKGKKDGIEKNMAIINEEGLIGIITEVNQKSSKVELLSSYETEISIVVHGNYGILSGYSKENKTLTINNMTNYDNIELGDLIYTSGLGNLPSGILVGKVENIEYDKYQIEKKIQVKSKVELDNLNYVGIILNLKDES